MVIPTESGEEGGNMARDVDAMRKPELVSEGVRLGLGSRAALGAQHVEALRVRVRAARLEGRGGR